MKLHDDELEINDNLVRNLICEQFPKFSTLPIKNLNSTGTDHNIYHLGSKMCIRLPRTSDAAKQVEVEQYWLPKFTNLPLEIPTPIGHGSPTDSYPLPWSIYNYIEGENTTITDISTSRDSAINLAKFLKSFQAIKTDGAHFCRRGSPLQTQDSEVRSAIKSLSDEIDTDIVLKLWETCLIAPKYSGQPVWIHGDLLPSNLIAKNGILSAIIDFGLMGIGDPACDLLPAWSIFGSDARNIFRQNMQIDDATWARGIGWALAISLTIIPYYRVTNPSITKIARRMLLEILSEK